MPAVGRLLSLTPAAYGNFDQSLLTKAAWGRTRPTAEVRYSYYRWSAARVNAVIQ